LEKLGIKTYIERNPLKVIILLALILRLTAAVFSKGYMMHDDHFLVVEAAQSWADGGDYNNWLPWNQVNPAPEGHSFFYVGIHFLIFKTLNFAQINDPQNKMLVIRLLHALFSMLTVWFAYKITRKISSEKNALSVALILAAAWFMPCFSVRNLVEVVATPLLIWSVWILTKNDQKKNLPYLFAGLLLGLAFSVRFQTAIFTGGVGLSLLFMKKFKGVIFVALGTVISILAIQGLVDFFIWHRPFAELGAYIEYNWKNKNEYGTNNQLMYISVITLIFTVPLGIMLLFGFFKTWKKQLLIFLPTFLFILFHNIFPNKQERFVFTMIPFFVITGIAGWNEFVQNSKNKERWTKFSRVSMKIFWILNIPALILFTTSYEKKARTESMYYFYKKNPKFILSEDSNRESVSMLPFFYAGYQGFQYILPQENRPDTISSKYFKQGSKFVRVIYLPEYFKTISRDSLPEYVLFYDDKNLDKRVARLKTIFPNMKIETVIGTSLVDAMFQKMNPINKNFPFYIYKTNTTK
jgi:4-amino-4-deoxy-L-arabinose transferase-like glycosyltransferase